MNKEALRKGFAALSNSINESSKASLAALKAFTSCPESRKLKDTRADWKTFTNPRLGKSWPKLERPKHGPRWRKYRALEQMRIERQLVSAYYVDIPSIPIDEIQIQLGQITRIIDGKLYLEVEMVASR